MFSKKFRFNPFIRPLFFISLALLNLCLISSHAEEETLPPAPPKKSGPSYTEIIVDASGSMEGKIKDEIKIQTAKKMISIFIKSVENDDNFVAVRTFGSRSGNCKDILLKLDFYKKDEASLNGIIGTITPKNRAKTPLAASMEAAFKHIKDQKGRKNLVVFTDGKETCGGDPCKVAKKLLKEMDVKIYLIAYGVTNKKELREMHCPVDPKEQNLKELNPDNPQDLAAAFAEVRKDVRQTQQGIIIKGPDPTAPATAKNAKGESFQFISGMGTELPPGSYTVTVSYNTPYVFKDVSIQPKSLRILTVTGEGSIKFAFMKPQMKVELINTESSKRFPLSPEGEATVPQGKYNVLATTNSGLAYQWPPVVIIPHGTLKLSNPPWGLLTYRTEKSQPIRVYKKESLNGADASLIGKAQGDSVTIKKILKDREPDFMGMSNSEILLEEGVYVLVFANGAVETDIKILRGKELQLP